MLCEKCGVEIIQTKNTEKKAYYQCPKCKQGFVYDKTTGKLSPAKKKSGCWKTLALLAVGFVLFIMLIGTLSEGGKDGITGLSVVFTLVAIALFVWQRRRWRVVLAGIVAYYLLLACAANNFPAAIRSIPGSTFLGLWWGLVIIACVVAVLADVIICRRIVAANEQALANLEYSDSDMMLLKKVGTPILTGYYLLKAQLCGIVRFRREDDDENPLFLVEKNPDIPQDQLDAFCEKNLQIKRIVTYLTEEEVCYFDDVLLDVHANPQIFSAGGLETTKLQDEIKHKDRVIFSIAAAVTYGLGLLKLLMGLYNNKPIALLLISFLFAAFAFWGIAHSIANSLVQKRILDPALQRILIEHRVFIENYEQYVQPFLSGDQTASPEEQHRILRHYATNVGALPKQQTKENLTIMAALLSDIAAAAATAARKSSSSSSGCSSCGGCGGGGCGGGCGGCGG